MRAESRAPRLTGPPRPCRRAGRRLVRQSPFHRLCPGVGEPQASTRVSLVHLPSLKMRREYSMHPWRSPREHWVGAAGTLRVRGASLLRTEPGAGQLRMAARPGVRGAGGCGSQQSWGWDRAVTGARSPTWMQEATGTGALWPGEEEGEQQEGVWAATALASGGRWMGLWHLQAASLLRWVLGRASVGWALLSPPIGHVHEAGEPAASQVCVGGASQHHTPSVSMVRNPDANKNTPRPGAGAAVRLPRAAAGPAGPSCLPPSSSGS